MKITVHYWGQIKQAAGRESEVVELPEAPTPRELVRHVAGLRGDPLQSFLLEDDGSPRRHLLLIVDDRHVNWDEETPLRDGAELTVMPPISGGLPA